MKLRAGRGFEFAAYGLAAVLFALSLDWSRPAPPFDPSVRWAGSLRVVTWNVGQALLQGAPPLLPTEEAHVLETLVRLDPDLVLLEELEDDAQVERIRESLGPEWQSAASWRGAGRLVALFAKDAELDPIQKRRLFALHGRATLGKVRFSRSDGSSRALWVAVVHAPAFSPEKRNDVLGRVRRQLDAASQGLARILGGDFNIDLNPNNRRDLLSDDSYLDVQTYNAILGTTSERGGLIDAAADQGPTAEPDRRLDYLFIEPSIPRILQAGPWRGRRAPGMDHDPLVADLAW